MSPLRLIILAVAGLAAVIAAILVRNLVGQAGPEEEPQTIEIIKEVEVSQVQVLVAREDVVVGTLLSPEHFAWADWPEQSLNPSFFTQDSHPDAMEELAGSVVRTAMYADEPILPVKIVVKGETGYMAALLNEGMRAISVEISPESASAGFILPNDRVDVIITYEVEVEVGGETEDRVYTRTILQNARILAIDQIFGTIDGMPALTGSTATMELTPEQSELVALASNIGELSLTLRSVHDANWNEGEVFAELSLIQADGGTGPEVKVYRNGEAGGSL